MLRTVLILLALTACASPDVRFRGADRHDVTLGRFTYAVYLLPPGGTRRVQVIRLGYARRADHLQILADMRVAAAQASGCAIVPGSDMRDSGVMTARLDCG